MQAIALVFVQAICCWAGFCRCSRIALLVSSHPEQLLGHLTWLGPTGSPDLGRCRRPHRHIHHRAPPVTIISTGTISYIIIVQVRHAQVSIATCRHRQVTLIFIRVGQYYAGTAVAPPTVIQITAGFVSSQHHHRTADPTPAAIRRLHQLYRSQAVTPGPNIASIQSPAITTKAAAIYYDDSSCAPTTAIATRRAAVFAAAAAVALAPCCTAQFAVICCRRNIFIYLLFIRPGRRRPGCWFGYTDTTVAPHHTDHSRPAPLSRAHRIRPPLFLSLFAAAAAAPPSLLLLSLHTAVGHQHYHHHQHRAHCCTAGLHIPHSGPPSSTAGSGSPVPSRVDQSPTVDRSRSPLPIAHKYRASYRHRHTPAPSLDTRTPPPFQIRSIAPDHIVRPTRRQLSGTSCCCCCRRCRLLLLPGSSQLSSCYLVV